ncbi:hypothetical protein [Methylomonas sp. 11b]|uniref:hypothetical protein n=1 Tax=Methylomonas sp. 11b TaxID=1168169 RepID=UPI00047E3CB4|nr:hypothetical protein [Methylomonas sp. 11b]
MSTREEVYVAINEERDYQDMKWGAIDEHSHEVGSWLTIMRYLLGKAESAYTTAHGDSASLDEIRQLVAVGVACMEQHGPIKREKIDLVAMRGSL